MARPATPQQRCCGSSIAMKHTVQYPVPVLSAGQVSATSGRGTAVGRLLKVLSIARYSPSQVTGGNGTDRATVLKYAVRRVRCTRYRRVCVSRPVAILRGRPDTTLKCVQCYKHISRHNTSHNLHPLRHLSKAHIPQTRNKCRETQLRRHTSAPQCPKPAIRQPHAHDVAASASATAAAAASAMLAVKPSAS